MRVEITKYREEGHRVRVYDERNGELLADEFQNYDETLEDTIEKAKKHAIDALEKKDSYQN